MTMMSAFAVLLYRLLPRRSDRPSPVPPRRRIIIVGGGFGGLAAARLMSPDPALDVTLVEPKDYFEYTPGILRALVAPRVLPRLHVPLHQAIPTRCRWVRGVVTATDAAARTVTVHAAEGSASSLPYDDLLLCTGAHYAPPIRPDNKTEAGQKDRVATILAAAAALSEAQSVLVIGGGIVGIELAAEVADAHPRANITLVSRSPALLREVSPAAGAHALRWLTRRGVDVRLGDDVASRTPLPTRRTQCALRSGTTLEADLVFGCTGGPPASAYLGGDPLLLQCIDPRRRVRTNSRLELREGVYAVGDVAVRSDVPAPDQRTAVNAELAARVVANGRSATTGPPGSLPHPLPRVMCISLGRRDGIVVFGQTVLCGGAWGIFAAALKRVIEWLKVAEVRQWPPAVLYYAFFDRLLLRLARRWSKIAVPPNPISQSVPVVPATASPFLAP